MKRVLLNTTGFVAVRFNSKYHGQGLARRLRRFTLVRSVAFRHSLQMLPRFTISNVTNRATANTVHFSEVSLSRYARSNSPHIVIGQLGNRAFFSKVRSVCALFRLLPDGLSQSCPERFPAGCQATDGQAEHNAHYRNCAELLHFREPGHSGVRKKNGALSPGVGSRQTCRSVIGLFFLGIEHLSRASNFPFYELLPKIVVQ